MYFKDYFPQLRDNPKVIYLDHAATTMMPEVVFDTIRDLNFNSRSNVHRGEHLWSSQISDLYEYSRHKIKEYLGAKAEEQIIFTSGGTESLNLAANLIDLNNFNNFNYIKQDAGKDKLQSKTKEEIIAINKSLEIKEGGTKNQRVKVLLTIDNHHSALCPWFLLKKNNPEKYEIEIIDLDENEDLDIEALTPKLKEADIFVFPHVSNLTGKLKSIDTLGSLCRKNNCLSLVDGSQYIPHDFINLTKGDIDFYCFSGHKLGSSFGCGILYIRNPEEITHITKSGGGMVDDITEESFRCSEMPFLLEPGTPNIEGAISLAASLSFLENIGLEVIKKKENKLKIHIEGYLKDLIQNDKLKLIGSFNRISPIFSFYTDYSKNFISPKLISEYLSSNEIFTRSGCHCVGLMSKKLKLEEGSIRISCNFTNSIKELDIVFEVLNKLLT